MRKTACVVKIVVISFTTFTNMLFIYTKTCKKQPENIKNPAVSAGFMVEHTGFEPVTSTMRM